MIALNLNESDNNLISLNQDSIIIILKYGQI